LFLDLIHSKGGGKTCIVYKEKREGDNRVIEERKRKRESKRKREREREKEREREREREREKRKEITFQVPTQS
jgi:hypothetical protein